MSEKIENKLKPCPFCGGEAHTAIEDCYGYYGDDWLVFCDECSLQFGFTKQFETEEEAIEAWNKRVYDHKLTYEEAILLSKNVAQR